MDVKIVFLNGIIKEEVYIDVGFRGPEPGSHIKVCQQTPILLALLAVTCLHRSKSYLKQYGRVLEPSFHTLKESR